MRSWPWSMAVLECSRRQELARTMQCESYTRPYYNWISADQDHPQRELIPLTILLRNLWIIILICSYISFSLLSNTPSNRFHFSSLSAMLAGFFIVFVTLVWFIRTWYNRQRYPPGPFPLPFIGNLHLLRKDIHLQMDKLAQHYGSVFTLWMAQIPFIVVTDIDIARKVSKLILE